MSIPTSEVRGPRSASVWTAGLVLVFLSGLLFACEDDVGRCCSTLDPDDSARIPVSTTSTAGGSQPTSDIALDPAFDCDSLVCVAYRGARAYCTEGCFEDDDCPENFVCRPVLETDPGPESQIRPGDRFCVREGHVCSD